MNNSGGPIESHCCYGIVLPSIKNNWHQRHRSCFHPQQLPVRAGRRRNSVLWSLQRAAHAAVGGRTEPPAPGRCLSSAPHGLRAPRPLQHRGAAPRIPLHVIPCTPPVRACVGSQTGAGIRALGTTQKRCQSLFSAAVSQAPAAGLGYIPVPRAQERSALHADDRGSGRGRHRPPLRQLCAGAQDSGSARGAICRERGVVLGHLPSLPTDTAQREAPVYYAYANRMKYARAAFVTVSRSSPIQRSTPDFGAVFRQVLCTVTPTAAHTRHSELGR